MNYKLIRNILLSAAGIIILLWCLFFYLVDETNALYKAHHKSSIELIPHESGKYATVVPVDKVSDEWEAEIKPQWEKLKSTAILISDIAIYGGVFVFSLSVVFTLDYLISKISKAEKR